jgi:hypothetical protein
MPFGELSIQELKERGFQRPIRAVHTICGGIVFWHNGVPRGKEFVPNPDDVILFNGAKPRMGDPIICTHCGYDVRKNQLEFLIKDD